MSGSARWEVCRARHLSLVTCDYFQHTRNECVGLTDKRADVMNGIWGSPDAMW
jgi:hypothetical protein